MSAPVFRPVMTLSAISLRLAASSFFPTAADPSFRPGYGETSRCPLADHGTFEIGEGSDHWRLSVQF
jgi:hypothetical protein